MKLYYAPGTCALAPHIVLEWIGLPYEAARVNPSSDEYRRINPLGMDEALAFLTGDMHPAFWPFFAPQRYTTKSDAESLTAVREAAYPRIDRAMLHLDAMLNGARHVVGGKRSIADPYALAMARWTENLPKTWKDYPAIRPFMEGMYAEASVAKVMPFRALSLDCLTGRINDLAERGQWSMVNGQAEGQISRLKILKRAMYRRAGPDLLRARMLSLHHTN